MKNTQWTEDMPWLKWILLGKKSINFSRFLMCSSLWKWGSIYMPIFESVSVGHSEPSVSLQRLFYLVEYWHWKEQQTDDIGRCKHCLTFDYAFLDLTLLSSTATSFFSPRDITFFFTILCYSDRCPREKEAAYIFYISDAWDNVPCACFVCSLLIPANIASEHIFDLFCPFLNEASCICGLVRMKRAS